MKDARGDPGRLRQYRIAGLSLLAMVPLVAGCQKDATPAGKEMEAANPSPSPSDSQNSAVSELSAIGRPELLAAAGAAADAVAAGDPLPKANLQLTNRNFELRLPFGCSDGILGNWGQWSLSPQTNVLRVTIRPQRWGDNPTFEAIAAGTPHDAAEGFWIERPWTRSEQCPVNLDPQAAPAPVAGASASSAATPSPPPVNTMAVVQYFSPDAPRTLRRGNRPYDYTAKLPGNNQTAPQGFRVKLVGRILGFADGQPIHCVVQRPAQPPTCAAAVEFTKVVLEDAVTGENLTEWGS